MSKIKYTWNKLVPLQNTSIFFVKSKMHELHWLFLRDNQHFFVKSTFLLKMLLKSWFHGNFWAWWHGTVLKFANFSPTHDILQKFRQINFLTKELYCKSIWRKNFAVGKISEISTLTVYHCITVSLHNYFVKSISY